MTLNDALHRDIKKVSRSVAFEWPGIVEAEDIEQAIWVHILESPGTQRDLDEMDPVSRYRTVSKIGHRIASQERDDYAYYKGSYRYSVADAKRLLNAGAVEDFELGAQTYDGDYVGGGDDELKSQIPDDVMDLRNALIHLAERNQGQATALIKRYRFFERPVGDADKSVLKRAHDSLVKEMNRVRRTDYVVRDDGPGTRRVVKREAARHLSKDGWDANYAPSARRDNHIEPEVWDE